MDYEKAYKDALQLARSYYDKGTNEFLDTIFPELAESEDEKTAREIKEFILYKAGHLLDEATEHRFIKYLEKQKEQLPAEWSDKLEIDTLRDWTMHFSPDIRAEIGATAYHFYNLGVNARKEGSK